MRPDEAKALRRAQLDADWSSNACERKRWSEAHAYFTCVKCGAVGAKGPCSKTLAGWLG